MKIAILLFALAALGCDDHYYAVGSGHVHDDRCCAHHWHDGCKVARPHPCSGDEC